MKFTIVLSALVAAVMAAPSVPAELEKRCDANGGEYLTNLAIFCSLFTMESLTFSSSSCLLVQHPVLQRLVCQCLPHRRCQLRQLPVHHQIERDNNTRGR